MREIARAHQEAQKTGICEVHKIKMLKETLPILWGEAVPPSPGEPSYQYRMQHFPNDIEVIEGGCVKIPGKKSQATFICSKCKEKALAWKKPAGSNHGLRAPWISRDVKAAHFE